MRYTDLKRMDRPWLDLLKPYWVGIWNTLSIFYFLFFMFICFAVSAVISKLSRDVSLCWCFMLVNGKLRALRFALASTCNWLRVHPVHQCVHRLFADTRLLIRKERWCSAPALRWHISATPPARWGRTPPRCRCEVRACPAAMLPGRSTGCRPAWTPSTASLSHLHAVDRRSRHLHQQPTSDQWF